MQYVRKKEKFSPYFIQNDDWFLYYHSNRYFTVKFENDKKLIKTSNKCNLKYKYEVEKVLKYFLNIKK